jgi:hypothetical protein
MKNSVLFKAFLLTIVILSCVTPEPKESTSSEDSLWLRILDEARWAQNAHNMQSWELTILSEDSLIGRLSPQRLLPQTDPISRQLIISLGAFSEVAHRSARSYGYDLQVNWIGPQVWVPGESEAADLFRWTLAPLDDTPSSADVELDALSSATVKYKVVEGSLDAAAQERLLQNYSTEQNRIFFVNPEDPRFLEVRDLSKEAYRIEMEYEPTLMESFDNTRVGEQERQAKPYGITLMGNFHQGMLGFVELFSGLFPMAPMEYTKTSIDLFNGAVDKTVQLMVLTSRGNSPEVQFLTGFPMQAAWMSALDQGFTLLPLSQGLQEYPQVQAQYDRLHQLLAQEGETVQMIFAVNRPEPGDFYNSPRLRPQALLAQQ